MKTKTIPFDLEMAKKIQAEEIEGRIVNHQTETVRIFAFDVKNKKCIVGAVKHALSDGEYIAEWDAKGRAFDPDVKESFLDLLIELPEETPKYDDVEEVQTGDGRIAFLRHKNHEFKPFDKVLVRDDDDEEWTCSLFSLKDDGGYNACGLIWNQCIPYEGNEHLVGTTDKPKEE